MRNGTQLDDELLCRKRHLSGVSPPDVDEGFVPAQTEWQAYKDCWHLVEAELEALEHWTQQTKVQNQIGAHGEYEV